jgi:hypothetical protein
MTLAVQTTGAVAVEELPCRRRRVYVATWAFKIGQAVRFGDMPALVLSRERSAMGCEIYYVWIMGPCAGRPYRSILRQFLIPISQNCAFK